MESGGQVSIGTVSEQVGDHIFIPAIQNIFYFVYSWYMK